MPQTKVVRLFKNGASQAVRLPAEFRFSGNTVYATKDETTGDVLLSQRPGASYWADFFRELRSIDVPSDFLVNRPMNRIPEERNIFGQEESENTDAAHARHRHLQLPDSRTVAANRRSPRNRRSK
ncbi:MAG TPA: hypothetical protein VKT75_08800 [Acidobacteriaceae bacterium]|nr:hypothetical protein [Acidobacteriaceae bacterium]